MGRLSSNYFLTYQQLKTFVPKWDYHLHSTFTDGKNTIEEMVNHALAIGMERIIFTEHTEPWLSQDGWFAEYVKQIRFFQKKEKGNIEILIGIESPAMDYETSLEMTDEMDKHCDFILGAAHRYPGIGDKKIKDLSINDSIDFEFRTLMALAHNPKIDAIAHIGATCTKYCGKFPEELMKKVIAAASKNGIAIEINHAYHSPIYKFLIMCKEKNTILTIGSNAHKKEDIGKIAKNNSEFFIQES
ncbi:MAG: PHP domain-containing protein [Bacteroidota bacterium]